MNMETLGSNEQSKEVIEDSFHYQEVGRFEVHFDEAFPTLTVSGEAPDGSRVGFSFTPSEILELAAFVTRNQAALDRVRDREDEFLQRDGKAVKIRASDQGPEPIPTNTSVGKNLNTDV